MIKFKKVTFSNVFSYGPVNSVQLDASPLTQLVGKNGYGKSSIALIIEEGLFNCNSKKIKKADILNRYAKDKVYTITVEFEKDGVSYTVNTTRSTTSSTVKLFRNSIDISNHTATGTYKTIEQILGFDQKTFSQIIYQSSVSSLEFLTATDTARKTFLIDLLNLTSYTKACDCFKKIAADMTKKVEATQVRINTIQSWLAKYKGEDLSIWPLEELPVEPVDLKSKVILLDHELDNIEITNKKITTNNTYKKILESIDISTPYVKIQYPNLKLWEIRAAEIKKEIKEGEALAKKPATKTIKCPTCSQDMDNSVMFSRIIAFKDREKDLYEELGLVEASIDQANINEQKWREYDKKIQEWEKYHSLVDLNLRPDSLDKDDLSNKIAILEKSIKDIELKISAIRSKNTLTEKHNSKAAVIKEQMDNMNSELIDNSRDLIQFTQELTNLSILVKAFSTTGLVAYKIECMVKDLEELTNEYLGIMADGRFQLSFKIASSDKLNVVITDNGRDIDIIALSSGERARVNVSTLLAIRKLMQNLSNSRTNLLILDETVENLDAEGKEKLIEVLLEEKSLNTFLISHGFSHPLLEKIYVVKENNISRLE